MGDTGESCRKKKEARIADWLSAPLFEVESYFPGKPPLMAAIQKGRIICDILFIRITLIIFNPGGSSDHRCLHCGQELQEDLFLRHGLARFGVGGDDGDHLRPVHRLARDHLDRRFRQGSRIMPDSDAAAAVLPLRTQSVKIQQVKVMVLGP